ncbi:methyltransferase, FkbM family [Tistlia consotensis]|uniref:Methyltransferase, FkbM family n=1 Tax=Tistlia consotensis USBA 355 TaxID=560819 RepID=A0A1Y6B8V7_9PROT|nr:FkbM family methyltransferase [Tistlia consotensis]SME99009.1 methyltransferase, FkbM family [Tistlia consotensis USBA 355]SNR77521.1 methyltransferase, FkbM family [Tistlia consotensis]
MTSSQQTPDAPQTARDLPRRLILSISSDIGLALAKAWLAEGCQVAGTYRTHSPALDELERAGAVLAPCDLSDAASVGAAARTLAAEGAWDVLVVAPGAMEPVGSFEAVGFDAWEQSVQVNFTAQLRALHGLLPARRRDSAQGPLVLFFAAGGTNGAPTNYSAYTVAKVASIKMCELLDAEIPDTRFAIVGPGWVKTKIHQATLDAKEAAGDNYRRTVEMLDGGDWVSMDKVVACCDWLVGAGRETIGGRNFSVAHDRWGTAELEALLADDPDMYKLRRAGNDKLVGKGAFRHVAPEELLARQFEVLPVDLDDHRPDAPAYAFLKAAAQHAVGQMFGPGNRRPRRFGPFGALTFPYHGMGAIDSLDLFGLDELILFAFYNANRGRYRKAGDVGANIGLHSLMLARSGFQVRCFEPDPVHAKLLRRNLELNGVADRVELIEAAVSDRPGQAEFVRVLGNTTGSHLSGAKANPYGELERFPVELKPIGEIMDWADLVKIDAEGHETQIIRGTTRAHWQGTDAVMEIGTPENAEIVFAHLKGLGVNLFAQKTGWRQVATVADMPTSYRDGSLFVTAAAAMPWGAGPG